MGNAKLDGVDVLEFAKNYAVEKCGQLYRGGVCDLAHCTATWTHNEGDAIQGVCHCVRSVVSTHGEMAERVDSDARVYFCGRSLGASTLEQSEPGAQWTHSTQPTGPT